MKKLRWSKIKKLNKYKNAGFQGMEKFCDGSSGESPLHPDTSGEDPADTDAKSPEDEGGHGNAKGMAQEAAEVAKEEGDAKEEGTEKSKTDNEEKTKEKDEENEDDDNSSEDGGESADTAPKRGDGSPGKPLNKCKHEVDGMCWEPYMCAKHGGQTESGHCTGGSDNACCVGYQEKPVPSEGGELPMPIFFGAKTQVREAALLKALCGTGIKGVEAQQFMAQMAHESDQFKAMEEYASGAAYEGRKDLGNTQSGDGKRFKGRGYIQLTGRANYKTFGKKMGIDLENNPTRASEPPIASKVALSYWFQRVKPRVKDFEDTKRVTKLINGGQNGLADRIKKLNKYKDAGFQPAEKLCAS